MRHINGLKIIWPFLCPKRKGDIMSLITLSKIGKIYVSEGNVSVGIRGIDLDFQAGEFVAVTGESGSGKSTLLNVISGMDTYEEGELYIEGEPTSHYVQSDWEEYRKQYISFIFQDYNIVNSFTVLENVELALLDYKDPAERRRRALELIDRVGLKKFIHKKGSKLSGGQKQRTVIARALAKDSPVILADEPTGNLDSKTSADILKLLKEVSAGKLVIIVTHDFSQVADLATRHIRVHDGSIEFDVPNEASSDIVTEPDADLTFVPQIAEDTFFHRFKNSFRLGLVRFKSTPKLSAFLSILMVVAAVGLFAVTAFSFKSFRDYETQPMFSHEKGRVIVIRQDGERLSEEELQKMAQTTGAVDTMHYDYLLDLALTATTSYNAYDYNTYELHVTDRRTVRPNVGKAPEKVNEISLRLPRSALADTERFEVGQLIKIESCVFTISGIEYVKNNTLPVIANLTEKGFDAFASICYMNRKVRSADMKDLMTLSGNRFVFALTDGDDSGFFLNSMNIPSSPEIPDEIRLTVKATFTQEDMGSGAELISEEVSSVIPSLKKLSAEDVRTYLKVQGNGPSDSVYSFGRAIFFLSADDAIAAGNEIFGGTYRQASLFYSSDGKAARAAGTLRESGYFAVPSNTKVSDFDNSFISILSTVGVTFLWILTVAFLTLFISLATTRAMMSTQGDLAIMRSMGIRVDVIRKAVYFQTFTTLIPAVIGVIVFAFVIYTVPATNASFSYLPLPAYLIILAGLVLIDYFIARKYNKKLFASSVKKTMKGE